MNYMNVSDAAEKWGISTRRVRILCEQGKILGVIKNRKSWSIPIDAEKPVDGRRLRNKSISSKFKKLFALIDSKLAELNRMRPLTAAETARLRNEFMIEFTYNSNAIEGNTLTLQETAMVLAEGITIDQKPLKDHLEVMGHKEAFTYVLSLVQDKAKLTEKVIKEIHSMVLLDRREESGKYRRIPVRIMGAFNEPPQPYLVPVQMEDLIIKYKEMQKTLHRVECAALFHLMFEGVHPFIDGNGRAGRLILNLDLMQAGYLPINVKFADRKKYYACFDEYYRNDNPDKMIELVAGYVLEQLERYLGIVEQKG